VKIGDAIVPFRKEEKGVSQGATGGVIGKGGRYERQEPKNKTIHQDQSLLQGRGVWDFATGREGLGKSMRQRNREGGGGRVDFRRRFAEP